MASYQISEDGIIRFKGVDYCPYPGKAYYYFTMLGERSKKVFGQEFNRLQSEQKPSLKREVAKVKAMLESIKEKHRDQTDGSIP